MAGKPQSRNCLAIGVVHGLVRCLATPFRGKAVQWGLL